MKYFIILFFAVSLSSQLVQAKDDDHHGEIPYAPDDDANSYYDYASFTYKEYPQYSERDHSLKLASTHTLPPTDHIKPEQIHVKDSNQNHNQDHKPKLDLDYDYDPADFQESSQVATEKNEEASSFSPNYYSPAMTNNFVNAVRHYHGDNLYRTYQQGRKVDAARAENIRERVMSSSSSNPELERYKHETDLLRKKNDFLEKASKHYKEQKERRNKLQENLSEDQSYYKQRKELVNTATEVLDVEKVYYRNSQLEEGYTASVFVDALLDLATSFTPGISLGRDVYEAITGLDLISGEELDTFSRSMSILGSVTFGVGSAVGKGFKVIGKVLKGGDKAEDALKATQKIVESAISLASKNPDLGRKLDYVLGRATGSSHNIERSQEMLRQMERIGLLDKEGTRTYLADHLKKTLEDSNSIFKIQENGRVVRESLLSGPRGIVKVESIWEDVKLITVKIFGKG